MIEAIDKQLKTKINSLSKEFSWKDTFSFIKNVDFELQQYKEIINLIETRIFLPYQNEEKLDILGRAYKIFLSRAGKVDNKNIILTPDHIKTLMIKLARLNLNDVIIDTCTGSGGFLMEAMERLISLAKEDNNIIKDIHENKLIGFEIDPILFSLSCSNMFLHGDGRTNLLYRSSLLNESKNIVNSTDTELINYIKKKKPSKCIINPPYENNLPIKFTLSAIDYLEPNGKLIIIMPTPTLTKNLKNGLTNQLLEKAKLDFVIKMPKNLFSEQNRRVNTSIFGFTKTPHQIYDETLFCYMEDDGFISVQKKGRIDKKNKWNDIENRILDIVNNSKNLDGISEKRKILTGTNQNTKIVPYGIRLQKPNSNMVKFSDIFECPIKGTLASESIDDEECKGNIDFITAAPEWKKCDKAEHDCEAIVYIVASDGCLGRCHYVNGKFTACNLSIVLKKKHGKFDINMRFYSYYLNRIKEKIVKDLEDGTSKMTINPDLLMDYYIDYIPIEKQNKFVDDFILPCINLKQKYKDIIDITNKKILELI
ncbi:MAG: N-6 DNA methylase [Alphaproteobacteria bacterium]|nr:N-6 DNA methylase [Alphaproteobacteria bacterium]